MNRLLAKITSQRFILRILSIIVVLGLWELAGVKEISFNFPTFSATAVSFWSLLVSGELLHAFALSFRSLAIGFSISAVVGVVWGLIIGTFGFANWATRMYLLILYGAPTAAIIPILTLTFGIGLWAEVAVVIMLSLPVVVLNTYAGVRNVNQSLLEMARSFGANRRQIFTKVVLPDATPMVMAGLRLGFSLGFVGMVLAELLIAPFGIGDLVSYYSSLFRYSHLFAVVATILVVGAALLSILKHLEDRLLRWKES